MTEKDTLREKTIDDIDTAALLYRAADAIRYFERISALPDCNSCGSKPKCKYLPMIGETTRINCPLWTDPDLKSQK